MCLNIFHRQLQKHQKEAEKVLHGEVLKKLRSIFQTGWWRRNEKIYQKANDKFEKLAKEYNEFEKKVYEIKKDKGEDSIEYTNAEKQLTKLRNEKDDALLSSVGNAMYQVIGGSSLKDALDALVSRSNKIERQFGYLDKESIKDGGRLDKFNYLLGFIGRSHSALKTFSARANYAAGFIARLEAARMDGRNISSPEVLMEIAYDSYIDWDRGKYQQSNFVTDVFNSINSHLENEYKGTKWDKYAKGLSTMLKFDVAITRVPVNILHEAVMEYTLEHLRQCIMVERNIKTHTKN